MSTSVRRAPNNEMRTASEPGTLVAWNETFEQSSQRTAAAAQSFSTTKRAR